jgi:hypothetical protein
MFIHKKQNNQTIADKKLNKNPKPGRKSYPHILATVDNLNTFVLGCLQVGETSMSPWGQQEIFSDLGQGIT